MLKTRVNIFPTRREGRRARSTGAGLLAPPHNRAEGLTEGMFEMLHTNTNTTTATTTTEAARTVRDIISEMETRHNVGTDGATLINRLVTSALKNAVTRRLAEQATKVFGDHELIQALTASDDITSHTVDNIPARIKCEKGITRELNRAIIRDLYYDGTIAVWIDLNSDTIRHGKRGDMPDNAVEVADLSQHYFRRERITCDMLKRAAVSGLLRDAAELGTDADAVTVAAIVIVESFGYWASLAYALTADAFAQVTGYDAEELACEAMDDYDDSSEADTTSDDDPSDNTSDPASTEAGAAPAPLLRTTTQPREMIIDKDGRAVRVMRAIRITLTETDKIDEDGHASPIATATIIDENGDEPGDNYRETFRMYAGTHYGLNTPVAQALEIVTNEAATNYRTGLNVPAAIMNREFREMWEEARENAAAMAKLYAKLHEAAGDPAHIDNHSDDDPDDDPTPNGPNGHDNASEASEADDTTSETVMTLPEDETETLSDNANSLVEAFRHEYTYRWSKQRTAQDGHMASGKIIASIPKDGTRGWIEWTTRDKDDPNTMWLCVEGETRPLHNGADLLSVVNHIREWIESENDHHQNANPQHATTTAKPQENTPNHADDNTSEASEADDTTSNADAKGARKDAAEAARKDVAAMTTSTKTSTTSTTKTTDDHTSALDIVDRYRAGQYADAEALETALRAAIRRDVDNAHDPDAIYECLLHNGATTMIEYDMDSGDIHAYGMSCAADCYSHVTIHGDIVAAIAGHIPSGWDEDLKRDAQWPAISAGDIWPDWLTEYLFDVLSDAIVDAIVDAIADTITTNAPAAEAGAAPADEIEPTKQLCIDVIAIDGHVTADHFDEDDETNAKLAELHNALVDRLIERHDGDDDRYEFYDGRVTSNWEYYTADVDVDEGATLIVEVQEGYDDAEWMNNTPCGHYVCFS